MNIVIIGAGKIGKTLTEHLSNENHDVIIIDKNPNVINDIVNQYDVRGFCGNGASYDTQINAGIIGADLIIASTSSDEVNILCCLVAKKIGIKKTIARVRNPEYAKQVILMREELGINMTFNPEADAADEISRILLFPSANKVETFANSKVYVVETKLNKNSPLIGKSLASFRSKYQLRVLVCAVKRGDEVYIPKGDFVLEENDYIYISGDNKETYKFFKHFNMHKDKLHDTMIIGGGRIAHYLTIKLLENNISVKILDNNYDICQNFSETFPQIDVINGDGTNQNILIEEGIRNIDSLVTLTGMDEINIIISTFANTLKCPKVVTKVNSNNYGSILNSVGLDSVISPKEVSANNIITYVRGMEASIGSKIKTLYKLVNNKVEAVEFYIPNKTDFTSIPIKHLQFKDNYLIACIIRNGVVFIPTGNDSIEPKDSVIIFTTSNSVKDITDMLR